MVFFSTDTCSYSVFTASLLQQGLRSKASPQITWIPQILSSPGSHVVSPDSALALCRVLYKSCFIPRPGKAPGSWGARRTTGMVEECSALECSPAPLPCLSMLSPHCKANFANTTSLLFTGWESESKMVELKTSRDWVQCMVSLYYLSFLRLPRGFWRDADKIQCITWAVLCSRGLANRPDPHKYVWEIQGWDDTGL